jgi:hypothetical protein
MKLVSLDGTKTLYWDHDYSSEWKESAFAIIQQAFQENPDVFPMTVILPYPKGKLSVIPIYYQTDFEKINRLAFISGLLKIFNIDWYIIASECWFVARQTTDPLNIRPSDCDDRQECLTVIQIERNGNHKTALFEIVRKDNIVEFKENNSLKMSEGRLFELFNSDISNEALDEIKKHFEDMGF